MSVRLGVTILISSGAGGVIGLVEAGAFEDYPGREQYSADVSATFRTNCQRFISHFLPGLKSMATIPAGIFIRWHTIVTPGLSRYAIANAIYIIIT